MNQSIIRRLEGTFPVVLFLLIIVSVKLYAQYEPVVIGASNLPTATAYNNSRKIVRDSSDVVHVFYQDEVDGRPVIWTTHALHGVEWSEPELFAYGSYPAVAISPEERIYVAYMNEDGGISIKSSTNNYVVFDNSIGGKYPTIATTQNYIFVAWQQMSDLYEVEKLKLYRLNPSLSSETDISYQLFSPYDSLYSNRPMISGDVHFGNDVYGIAWTDSNTIGNENKVKLLYSEDNDSNIFLFSDNLEEIYHCTNPSVSVERNYLHVSCTDYVNKGIISSIVYYSDYAQAFDYFNYSFYNTGTIPWVCTDDIYYPSCAIIWLDGPNIYYDQEIDGDLSFEPLIRISKGDAPKYYPNVGYKLYRAYSFDTIWTQGESAPYEIVYVRARKSRFPQYMEHECWSTPPVEVPYLKESVYREFSFWGGEGKVAFSVFYSDPELGTIRTKKSTDGYYDQIIGTPIASGKYKFTVDYTDSDFPPSHFQYTEYITVYNTKPELVSDTLVHVTENDDFSYTAHAIEPEGNTVYYTFQNYPSWVTPGDSVLSGTVPTNVADTSFTVIATDGELSDTMKVQIIIDEDPMAVERDNVPAEFMLYPCHPNPFNPVTQIMFDLPQAEQVELGVYNMRGQRVATLVNGYRAAGQHRVTWDAADHPSGVYWYRITAGQYSAVKKMVLVK